MAIIPVLRCPSYVGEFQYDVSYTVTAVPFALASWAYSCACDLSLCSLSQLASACDAVRFLPGPAVCDHRSHVAASCVRWATLCVGVVQAFPYLLIGWWTLDACWGTKYALVAHVCCHF